MTYRSLYKGDVLTDRERKNMIFLDVIRRNGPIAKTDIARITRHNIVTVSNYIENYLKTKLVIEKGLDVSSGGRRPELIELNADWGYSVGVDIGPTQIVAVVTTLTPKILLKKTVARPRAHMESVLSTAVELAQSVITESGVDRSKIKGIGVGISGVIDKHTGTVRDTDPERGVTSGNYISAKSMLEKQLGIPVSIGNDASLACLAEKKLSLRLDDENILYMYGDVGSGLIARNELFWGSSWSAGEIQLNLNSSEELNLPEWIKTSHYFHSRGLDMGIMADVKALLKKSPEKTSLWEKIDKDVNKLTLEVVFDAVKSGDEEVRKIVDPAIALLGVKISYLTNFLNPEVVVIGGPLQVGGDYVVNGVRRIVKNMVMEEISSSVKIIMNRLGAEAVVLGAVSLVIQELFAEV